jgi:ribosomal protein S16
MQLEKTMTQSQSVIVSDRTFSTITEAAEFHGVPLSTAAKRLGKGWTPEEAFGINIAPNANLKNTSLLHKDNIDEQFQSKLIKVRDKSYSSIAEFARAHNCKPQLIRSRIHRGMSPSEAIGLGEYEPSSEVKYKVSGNTFSSIDSLAKHFHANPNKVQKRIDDGWSVAQAVGLMQKPQKEISRQGTVSLLVNGKTYLSVSDIAKQLDIPYVELVREISKGKSAQEAVKSLLKVTSTKNVMVNGDTFKSLHQIAKKFNLNISSFYQRIKKGDTPEDAVNYLIPKEGDPTREPGKRGRRGNIVEFDGKSFGSVREFAKSYGFSPHKVAYRLKLKWTFGQSIDKEAPPGGFKASRTSESNVPHEDITYRGKDYRSVRAFASAYNVSPHKVRYRIQKGWTLSQSIERTPAPVGASKTHDDGLSEKQVKISSLLPLNIDGLSFSSAKELATHFNQNVARVTGRLRNGWTIEQSVGNVSHERAHTRRIIGEIKVGRNQFQTVIELAEFFQLSYRVVQYRLSQGATPTQAVGKEPWSAGVHKGKEVLFRDKTYPSLIELAKAYDADYNKMLGRIHRDWTLEEALGLANHKKAKDDQDTLTSTNKNVRKKQNMVDDMFPELSESIKLGRRKFSTVSEFAEHLNLDPLITLNRIKEGWTPKQIAGQETPPNW